MGVPKSKLSRRIALLEQRLGVRLIQRSTRRFSVTDIGQSYYNHCKAIFPSRRRLLPSVRKLIDFLAARFEQIDED